MDINLPENSSNLIRKDYIIYNDINYTLEEFLNVILNLNNFDNKNNIHYGDGVYTFDEFINFILYRNLKENRYSFDLDYKDYATSSAGNLFRFNNDTKLGNFGNALLDVIPQYNSLNLSNTLIGRGIDFGLFGNITPLESIGSVMLGKQMTFNAVSQAARTTADYLPSINIQNLFTNEPIFSKPADYSITKLNITGFDFVDNLLSPSFYKSQRIDSNYEHIINENEIVDYTGKGQLNELFRQLNFNFYKFNSLYEYRVKYNIKGQKDLIDELKGKRFDFFYNPYSILYGSDMIKTYSDKLPETYAGAEEYVSDIHDISFFYGKTTNQELTEIPKDFITNYDSEDDIQNNLIWGKDGVGQIVHFNLDNSRDKYTKELINNNIENFKIKRGLLEYTKNLLNVSSGFYVDMTKKIYRDLNKRRIYGFNGSPVWEKELTKYSSKNFKGRKEGIRQHNALDKYDKFVKAIRFDGNIAYNKSGNNKDSVIYNSVMPKIHPIRDDKGNVDNKNMMFSIENLAVTAVKDELNNIGYIDDEDGSQIPISEVGPFNGRIMWFPPYGIELNETSTAKFDSTVMVGRNEPIYTYMNSERSATLSFVLLIDHPPHLINYMGEEEYKKKIANFFAFGGDDYYEDSVSISDLTKRIEDIKQEIDNIKKDNLINSGEIVADGLNLENLPSIYFPNDYPKEGGVSNVIDYIYNNKYEISNKNSTIEGDEGSSGLNDNIYVLSADTSQYNAINENCLLNKTLKEVYVDNNNKKVIGIKLEGYASRHGDNIDGYNTILVERRLEAAKIFILKRLNALFPNNDFVDEDIFIEIVNKGSNYSDDVDDKNINEVKGDRRVELSFVHNGKTISEDGTVSDNQYELEIKELEKELENLYTTLYRARNRKDNIFTERTKEDKAIFDNFESIKTNHYKPMYHSQTPEDFHKRLTFLQQCTRQGSSVRNRNIKDKDNLTSKNSVFGKQPICILRVGDFFYTKVIINNVTVDYNDTTWDMNPEGFGMQPMIAKVTLQMNVLGGQSLSGPIDALQNAVSYNYYANSTFTNTGIYKKASRIAREQQAYFKEIKKDIIDNMKSRYNELKTNNNLS